MMCVWMQITEMIEIMCTMIWMEKTKYEKWTLGLLALNNSLPTKTLLRYDLRQHRRVLVSCPKAKKSHNSLMGGTDQKDQITR